MGPNSSRAAPSFGFKTIPDGLPTTDDESTQDLFKLCASIEKHCLSPFKGLIQELNKACDVPRVSCIVADPGMFFTLNAAQEFGIPEVLLWTASACGLLGYAYCQTFFELGVVPFKDENFITNGELNRVIDWVPGVNNIRLKDMPSIIRITDSNDFVINFMQRLLHQSSKASAVLLNTFDALEHDVLQALSSNFPPLYAIGPLQLLNSININNDEEMNKISTSLWKQDPKCIEWLDSYAPKSVVYVNFGSITVLTNDQLLEFAWGLANSKHPFLWITRHDLVIGETAVLPIEFSIETKNRGYITS